MGVGFERDLEEVVQGETQSYGGLRVHGSVNTS